MASNRPLPGDLTVTGMDQKSLHTWMSNITDLVNELQTDHATYKSVVDELVTDHATTKTTVDASRTAIIELSDDHDTNQTHMTNLKTLVNNIRTYLTGDRLWSGNPGLAIDTNFDVKTGAACVVSIDGVLANVAASASADTGTAADLPAAKWGVFLVTAAANGSLTATWATASGAGYASEAAAIAALPAAPASKAPVGYVTVLAHATAGFTAGTDALQTGTGGSVSPDTNYYNLADALSTITAAVSTSSEAGLAAPDPAAGPATLSNAAPASLSNSTALTLLRS